MKKEKSTMMRMKARMEEGVKRQNVGPASREKGEERFVGDIFPAKVTED